MRTRLALPLAVLLGVTAFAPAPLPRRPRQSSDEVTLARMAGIWDVLSFDRYGGQGQVTYRVTAWKSIDLRGGKWTFCREANGGGPSSSFPLRLGPQRPARLDFCWREEKRVAMSGIVRFRGDLLEVLYRTSPLDHSIPLTFDKPLAEFYLVRLKRSQ